MNQKMTKPEDVVAGLYVVIDAVSGFVRLPTLQSHKSGMPSTYAHTSFQYETLNRPETDDVVDWYENMNRSISPCWLTPRKHRTIPPAMKSAFT